MRPPGRAPRGWRSSSRPVCLAVCVVGGLLIYASAAYTILRPATAPSGQPAMEVEEGEARMEERVEEESFRIDTDSDDVISTAAKPTAAPILNVL